MRTTGLYIALVTIVVASAVGEGPTAGTGSPGDPELLFQFARDLQQSGDFETARVEYLRMMSYYPHSVRSSEANLGVYDCLYEARRYVEALSWIEKSLAGSRMSDAWMDTLSLLRGNCNFSLYRFVTAGEDYQGATDSKTPAGERARIMRGICQLHLGNWRAANGEFSLVPESSGMRGDAERFAAAALAYPEIPRKSSKTAGILSTILPGLGYVYAGHVQTGIASFVVNSLFVSATVLSFEHHHEGAGAAISLFALGWYTSNIYGSVVAAYRYNEYHRDRYFDQFAGWP